MKKAFLLHPYENVNGNLRWPSKNQFEQVKVSESLEELRKLGYWASAFPEGDGITFSKDEYSSQQALADFVKTFSWLEVEECELYELNEKMRAVLMDQKSVCNILVPIRSLKIEDSFQIGEYKFWSPYDLENPWIDYFGAYHLYSEVNTEEWSEELKTEMDLLRFPLVELTIEVNEADLVGLNNSINSEVNLIRIASELADRGLDLLRITHCHYKRIEYLPDRAGQLADGFTAAYIIPEQQEYKEKLLVHIVYSMRTTNNWLGLEAKYVSDPFVEWLARLLKGKTNNEIEKSVRSAVISMSQAFYTIYDEARFLSLVFSLDGLCSPKRNWTGWKHRSYIAAVTSVGNVNSYEKDLRKFEHLYTNIRNKLVHAGSSFIDIEGENPMSVSQDIHSLIIRIIMTIHQKGITSIEELHDFAITLLQKSEYKQVTDNVINDYDLIRGKQTPQKDKPNW